ncbi:hypothetical protein QBC43DRAFT_335622 [Cladorrhinum sp. PSN259]|nr:hypothetical protein QBC43DRAFT_335622 [Cladorrhinum sp. PSN259]
MHWRSVQILSLREQALLGSVGVEQAREAVILGRLEIDIQSAINAYLALSRTIFKPRRKAFNLISRLSNAIRAYARFDTARLEQCIKAIVKERLGDKNAPLLQEKEKKRYRDPSFIYAIRRENTQPVFLAATTRIAATRCHTPSRKACQATAAAVSIFKPICIGPFKKDFINGAIEFNNPFNKVLIEGRDLWPKTIIPQNIGCLINIGTAGLHPNSLFRASAVQASRVLLCIALKTEKTAKRFHRAFPTLVSLNKYFRFNVLKGLENISLSKHNKINILTATTRAYLHLKSSQIQLQSATITLASRLLSTGGIEQPPVRSLYTTSSVPILARTTPIASDARPSVTAKDTDILGYDKQGVSASDLQTFNSIQSWVKSFRSESKVYENVTNVSGMKKSAS